ncbi:MAG: hypothetical protein Q7R34_15790 [Dehalococcoidia bacterium]|nr:hypothetical protein [Dehalococcoidia bacterium]
MIGSVRRVRNRRLFAVLAFAIIIVLIMNTLVGSAMALAAALLPAPTLSSPGPGATGVTTKPTFIWSQVSGANYYWLIVADSPSKLPTIPSAPNAPGCVIGSNGVGIAVTSYTPASGVLSPGITYYWEVQAYHGSDALHPDQQGQYSSVRSFTTQAAATADSAVQPASHGRRRVCEPDLEFSCQHWWLSDNQLQDIPGDILRQ